MALNKSDKANFETLKKAALLQDLCLLEARRKSDGKRVSLVCAVNHESDDQGEEKFVMVPVAVMIEGNPYEDFEPPAPEGGYVNTDPSEETEVKRFECPVCQKQIEKIAEDIDRQIIEEMKDRCEDDYRAYEALRDKKEEP